MTSLHSVPNNIGVRKSKNPFSQFYVSIQFYLPFTQFTRVFFKCDYEQLLNIYQLSKIIGTQTTISQLITVKHNVRSSGFTHSLSTRTFFYFHAQCTMGRCVVYGIYGRVSPKSLHPLPPRAHTTLVSLVFLARRYTKYSRFVPQICFMAVYRSVL